MDDEEIESGFREVIQTAGPLGFHLAKAVEEIRRLRRALLDAEEHIRQIREVVGREDD